jgi:hypothetical protein
MWSFLVVLVDFLLMCKIEDPLGDGDGDKKCIKIAFEY